MANKKDGPPKEPKEPKAKKPKASGSSRKSKSNASNAANTSGIGTPPSGDSNHASSQPPTSQQPPPQQTPPQPQTPQQQQQQQQTGVIPRPPPQHQQQQPSHMMYPQHSQYPPQQHQPSMYYPQQQYGPPPPPPPHQMQGSQQIQPHLQHYSQQAQAPHPSQHPAPGYMASPYPNNYPNQTSPSPHHMSHSPHGPPHPPGYSAHPQIIPSYSGSQAPPHHQGQPIAPQQHPTQQPPPQQPHMQHHQQHMPHPPTAQPHPRPSPQYQMHNQQQVPGSQPSSQPHLQQHMPPSHPHHHPPHPPTQQQPYPGGQFGPPHQQPPHMMYQQQPSQYPQHQASMYYQQQPNQGYQSIQQQPYGSQSHQMQHHQQIQPHLQHYSQQPQHPHPGQHPSNPGYMASPYTNQTRSPHHMSHSPHGPPHPSGYSGHPSSGPPPQHYSQAHPPPHMPGSYSGSQSQPHHPNQPLVPAQHQTQPPPQHMHHQHIPHPQPSQHARPAQPSQYPMHTPQQISQTPSQPHPQHMSPSHPHQHHSPHTPHASHTPHPPAPQQPYPSPGQSSQFVQPPQQPAVPTQASANHPPHHPSNQHHHHPQQPPALAYSGPQHGPSAQPHAQPSVQHTTQPSRPSSTGQQTQQSSATVQTPPGQVQQVRRDITFPPGCVETTQPTITKRRKLTSKDVSSIEVWRLFMCLKSGLLAEASWAIDVLGILLNDDTTVMQFALQHLPGLLEAILEHYKRCLNEIFEGFIEDSIITKPKPKFKSLTNGSVKNTQSISKENEDTSTVIKLETKMNGFKDDTSSSIEDSKQSKTNQSNPSLDDSKNQMVMFSSRNPELNYTYRTRDGRKVTLKSKEPPAFENNTWDIFDQEPGDGISNWKDGKSEDLSHIQVFFEPKKLKERIFIPESKQNGEVELEDEADTKGEVFFNSMKDCLMTLARRCICLSTLIRNLSFVPGNDTEMSKHAGLLLVLGRLLLLKHRHAPKKHTLSSSESTSDLNEDSTKEQNSESNKDANKDSSKESKNNSNKDPEKESNRESNRESNKGSRKEINGESIKKSNGESNKDSNKDEDEWYWSMLHLVRENTLVTISNISSSLDLSPFNDRIVLSLLEGLLHWAVCPSSYALDPFPTTSMMISPQRLSFESLAKLSIIEGNVDLILATPPWSRLEKLFNVLSRSLGPHEDQTIREFALVLLSNLASAGSSVARTIALTSNIITQLIAFIETAEATAQEVERNHGHEALKDPEATGTTLDMLRRAAHTLKCMSQLSDNHSLFVQHQQRLLSLVMSRILDPGVVPIIADVIFEISSTS